LRETIQTSIPNPEAIAWIERGDPFDLALLDYQMSDINGVMLARSLHQYRDRQQLPIILLSSVMVDISKEESTIAATMLKPIKPDLLLAKISALFAQQQSISNTESIDSPLPPRTRQRKTSFYLGS
jgi:CheY-like chemotaxis protein